MLRGSHDNWEKLVAAVLDREELRRIAYCESLSSSITDDFSSRLSNDSVNAFWISGKTMEQAASSDHHGDAQLMRFKELKKATKNFLHDMLLGRGTFGVFKGWINERTLRASKHGSGMAVAVKKQSWESRQGYGEYTKEIKYPSQLRHPNLVKLIGCCSEEDNLILVYDFIPRGSLDNHLFRRSHESLSWATRMRVAIGVANLPYLSCMTRQHQLSTVVVSVVTFFWTTANHKPIPGVQEFNSKLSYFGFARDWNGPIGGKTHVTTRVAGHLTEKADMFSFGVVLLELLSGRRVLDMTQRKEGQNLVEWAERNVGNKRKMLQIMDTRLEDQYSQNEAYIVAKLACRCLHRVPGKRPRMVEVMIALQQLESPF